MSTSIDTSVQEIQTDWSLFENVDVSVSAEPQTTSIEIQTQIEVDEKSVRNYLSHPISNFRH